MGYRSIFRWRFGHNFVKFLSKIWRNCDENGIEHNFANNLVTISPFFLKIIEIVLIKKIIIYIGHNFADTLVIISRRSYAHFCQMNACSFISEL